MSTTQNWRRLLIIETLEQLIKAAKEAWHAIDDKILKHLCESMPHRVQAVLLADGWYTKY